MIKDDEIRFLIHVYIRCSLYGDKPANIINSDDFYMHTKRARYCLDKWKNKDWLWSGFNPEFGWLTLTGDSIAEKIIQDEIALHAPKNNNVIDFIKAAEAKKSIVPAYSQEDMDQTIRFTYATLKVIVSKYEYLQTVVDTDTVPLPSLDSELHSKIIFSLIDQASSEMLDDEEFMELHDSGGTNVMLELAISDRIANRTIELLLGTLHGGSPINEK